MRGIAYLALAAFDGHRSCSTRRGGKQKSCKFANGIEHVVYVQFDNVHFTRDNPNVPSELEQILNLLNFLEGQGTLFTNHHTPLISHTSVDIVTSLTGVYGDKFWVSSLANAAVDMPVKVRKPRSPTSALITLGAAAQGAGATCRFGRAMPRLRSSKRRATRSPPSATTSPAR